MELFDSIIAETARLGGGSAPRRYAYADVVPWPDSGEFELVMLRDAAFELGGGGRGAVNFTCVTTDENLVGSDEILLWGPDLTELRGDCGFIRVTLLRVRNIDLEGDDPEAAFRAVQDLDFVKYRVFPKGYMIRTSSESDREQVRVSREALKGGVSFARVGADFIRQYKENPNVLNARILFITAPDADHALAKKLAKSAHDITMSLSKILEGLPTDCASCQLKPICDEVEGMKELHFGRNKKQT